MTIEMIRDVIGQLTDLKPELLLGVACIAVCYALKFMPCFPNKWIPSVCILMPAILYPLLADPSQEAQYPHFPQVRHALIGLVIGTISWAAHHQFLRKYLDPILEKSSEPKDPAGG